MFILGRFLIELFTVFNFYFMLVHSLAFLIIIALIEDVVGGKHCEISIAK